MISRREALIAAVGGGWPARGESAPERPYVRLFTLIRSGPLERHSRELIRFIGGTYGWINSHAGSWLEGSGQRTEYPLGGEVARRLRRINPAIILTNYRNGAYTSQNAVAEAGEVERGLPLSIAVSDSGARLIGPVAAGDTELLVRAPDEPARKLPRIYPFKASSTPETYSGDKSRYVAWLRLNQEILRINAAEPADNNQIRLKVARGYWKTTAADHPAASLVLAPVYSGSASSSGREYYLSGLPGGNSPQRALRYVMMQQRQDFWDWLAGKTREIFDAGMTGPWYDCCGATSINNSNAYGVRVAPYDVDLKRPLDHETYREYQQRKFDYLFKKFPGRELFLNWVFPQNYFADGRMRLMFSGANGHHPISGGAIETYATEKMDWPQLMRMQIDMVRSGYRYVAWVKEGQSDTDMSADYLLFAYCTFLLVFEPDAQQYWGGGWKSRGRHGEFTPPAFVYHDLGKPLDRFDDIQKAQMKNAPGIFRRRFANGVVLVNPDENKPAHVELDRDYMEPETGARVRTPHLEPRSGVLLLNPT